MKNKFLIGLTTMGLVLVLFTGCSKLPQAEIDLANAAIEEAKAAGADIYKPNDFITLQDSMKSVMVNIESQKSKFIKNYSNAKKELESVTALAQNVKQETFIRKEEVKLEIQNMNVEVKKLIETNKQLISEAPKGKEGATALMAIKGELSVVETSLSEAEAYFQKEEYLTSLDIVKSAKDKATALNEELSGVIAKYKASRR